MPCAQHDSFPHLKLSVFIAFMLFTFLFQVFFSFVRVWIEVIQLESVIRRLWFLKINTFFIKALLYFSHVNWFITSIRINQDRNYFLNFIIHLAITKRRPLLRTFTMTEEKAFETQEFMLKFQRKQFNCADANEKERKSTWFLETSASFHSWNSKKCCY